MNRNKHGERERERWGEREEQLKWSYRMVWAVVDLALECRCHKNPRTQFTTRQKRQCIFALIYARIIWMKRTRARTHTRTKSLAGENVLDAWGAVSGRLINFKFGHKKSEKSKIEKATMLGDTATRPLKRVVMTSVSNPIADTIKARRFEIGIGVRVERQVTLFNIQL